MKTNFLFLLFSLFMLQQHAWALSRHWDRRLSGQTSSFKDDLNVRLRAMSIDELEKMIERVKAFELEKQLEAERRERVRKEENMKREREEKRRKLIFQALMESRFGASSFFKDFFAYRM